MAYPLTPDGGGESTTQSSYIVMPLHHDAFESDVKQFMGFSIFGPSIPTDNAQVNISHRLRGSAGMPPAESTGAFVPLGTPFTFNGQRIDAPNALAGVAIEVMVAFQAGMAGGSPILEGVGIHERLVPAFRRDFTFSADARDLTARRDGASIRQSGRFLRDLVMQVAAAPATVALEFPDETVLDVAIFDYSERMVAHSAFGGQAWAIDCQATQFGLKETYGTVGRRRGTTIGDTRGFTIARLRDF